MAVQIINVPSYFLVKSVAAKSDFITEAFLSVNLFSAAATLFSFKGASRSAARCGYSKRPEERQRLYG